MKLSIFPVILLAASSAQAWKWQIFDANIGGGSFATGKKGTRSVGCSRFKAIPKNMMQLVGVQEMQDCALSTFDSKASCASGTDEGISMVTRVLTRDQNNVAITWRQKPMS